LPDTQPDATGPDPGERQIVLSFQAPDGFTGALDAQAFPDFFSAMVRALRLTTEYLAADKTKRAEFKLVKATYNSPFRAVLEETTGLPDATISQATAFVGDVVARVVSGKDIPAGLPGTLVRSYHAAAALSKRSNLVAAMRARNGRSFIRPDAADRFDLAFKEDAEVDGSIEGLLQVLNVRGRPTIRLWPNEGPPVRGRLPRKLLPKAKAGIEETVILSGTLIYYPNENHPRRIRVQDIEIVPKLDGDISFDDLWGAGRHHRPHLSSLDLIEEMRSGWD
jgi:hypothetical protein